MTALDVSAVHSRPRGAGEHLPEQGAAAGDEQLPARRRHERRGHPHDLAGGGQPVVGAPAEDQRPEVDDRRRVEQGQAEQGEVRARRAKSCRRRRGRAQRRADG